MVGTRPQQAKMLLGQGVANVAKGAQSAKTIGKGVVNTVRSYIKFAGVLAAAAAAMVTC
jgi:hypothetical protein